MFSRKMIHPMLFIFLIALFSMLGQVRSAPAQQMTNATMTAPTSSQSPHGRVKRFEWPWEIIGKELCKTAAGCSCNWAKCVPSPGYKASNCCDEGYVWSCCGKPV